MHVTKVTTAQIHVKFSENYHKDSKMRYYFIQRAHWNGVRVISFIIRC